MDLDRLLAWVEPSVATDFPAPPYDDAAAHPTLAAAGRSAQAHERFLQRWNGCYALGRKLHVFGACAAPPNHSLNAWNHPDGWRRAFGRLAEGAWFFAENGLGDQFGYRDGKVVWLRANEGRLERMAASFPEWLECVTIEPGRFLAADLFDACEARLGPLPYGGHFSPDPTVTLGAPFDPRHAAVVPLRDSMEHKGAAAAARAGGAIAPGR